MMARCLNPNAPDYVRYGGRGITVCDRWRTFANFLADMGVRPAGLTLDRVDNSGNYEPDNCRWATLLEQRHNRRSQRLRDQCHRGHAYTPENTLNLKGGKRRCRICKHWKNT